VFGVELLLRVLGGFPTASPTPAGKSPRPLNAFSVFFFAPFLVVCNGLWRQFPDFDFVDPDVALSGGNDLNSRWHNRISENQRWENQRCQESITRKSKVSGINYD
jgi:hypothetical protein